MTETIFISYAHSSAEHRARVGDLTKALRDAGFHVAYDGDVRTPQGPPEGWPLWMERQFESARWILVVCDEAYVKHYRGADVPGRGHGATWEGAIARQDLYDHGSVNRRFIPVLLDGGRAEHIPKPLRGATHYRCPAEILALTNALREGAVPEQRPPATSTTQVPADATLTDGVPSGDTPEGRQLDATVQVKKLLEQLRNARRERFVFLLVGRTGVGKSSTVNTLLGRQVAPVGDYDPTTVSVEAYDSEINGVRFAIIDTPGLCDEVATAGNDQRYLAMIRAKVPVLDCLWFVTRLDETRITADEKYGVQLICKALPRSVWDHALIVFTFACSIPEDRFNIVVRERARRIREEIGKHVPLRLAEQIPIVAVDNTSATTPDGRKWLGELFTMTLVRIAARGAAPFFLAMAESIAPQRRSVGGSVRSPHAEARPRIELSSAQKEIVKRQIDAKIIPGCAAMGATIGVLAFGPVGAAVGGLIGAGLGALAWFSE